MVTRHRDHLLCVCGKLCFSNPGLANHQKKCSMAQEAKSNGSKPSRKVVLDDVVYVKEIQGFVSLSEEIAADAHNAMVMGNKSAARRARNKLNDLRHKIPEIRKMLLDKVKNG